MVKRMWINQPSTLLPLHHLHGMNVLVEPDTGSVMRVYFLSGNVVSQQVPKMALSDGWLPKPDVMNSALNLIRDYVVQPDVQENMSETAVRAREVIKKVREEIEDIGKSMLYDFEVGPVACIIATPYKPGVSRGSASLSFGVHKPDSETQIAFDVTVTPLYK